MKLTHEIHTALLKAIDVHGSQIQLADASNISPKNISKYVNKNVKNIEEDTWKKLHPFIIDYLPTMHHNGKVMPIVSLREINTLSFAYEGQKYNETIVQISSQDEYSACLKYDDNEILKVFMSKDEWTQWSKYSNWEKLNVLKNTQKNFSKNFNEKLVNHTENEVIS